MAGTKLLKSKLVNQIDYVANEKDGIDLTKLYVTDRVNIHWVCTRHGTFMQKIQYRHYGYACPECAHESRLKNHGQRVIETKLEPEIDYVINKEQGINLEFITKAYMGKIYWKCLEGHTSYPASPKHRLYDGTGCPICARRQLGDSSRTISVLRPDLVKYYNAGDNEFGPDEVLLNSLIEAHWICAEGHKFKAPPHNVRQTKMGAKNITCGICTNKVIVRGINDFGTLQADLMDEWDWVVNKDIDPYGIPEGYSKKAGWICRDNRDHRWSAVVAYRSNGTGCPHCFKARQTSIPQLTIYFMFKKVLHNTVNRGRLVESEADVKLEDVKLALEYDGMAWHIDAEKRYKKNEEAKSIGYDFICIVEYNDRYDDKTIVIDKESKFIMYFNIKNNYAGMEELCNTLIAMVNQAYSLDIKHTKDDYKSALKEARLWLNKVLTGESFADKFKYYMPIWDKDANDEIGLDPNNIGPYVHIKANWKCTQCGHTWAHDISTVGRTGLKCPNCRCNPLSIIDYTKYYNIEDIYRYGMKIERLRIGDTDIAGNMAGFYILGIFIKHIVDTHSSKVTNKDKWIIISDTNIERYLNIANTNIHIYKYTKVKTALRLIADILKETQLDQDYIQLKVTKDRLYRK